MMSIIVGVLLGVGVIVYFTRPNQVQDQEILEDIKYQNKKFDEMDGKHKYEDKDFVEIINLLDETKKGQQNGEIKKRFNKIEDPDKRMKIKAMLTKEYDNGKGKPIRSLEEIEQEMTLFTAEKTSKDTMKFFGRIFFELLFLIVFVTFFYSQFLAKKGEMKKIYSLVGF
mmetsp:Transcript_10861/g.12314  ORF Transcript_10861/g.12314 Transcript_10861/m.12314 type:complete len:169 (+) Transcript_10861:27-533(+)